MSSPTTILSLHLSLLLLFLSLRSSLLSSTPSAYEVLESFDFPRGLLPKGVTSCQLNRAMGEFKVHLSETYKFYIQSYELEYKSTITEVITRDRLTKLKQVSVKLLFLWLSIVKVVKDGDGLQLSVGVTSANFPLDWFNESPSCCCGFDDFGQGVGEEEVEKIESVDVGLLKFPPPR
ncbi:hypothetical protein Cgig2_017257 [Carnegiea gigantea]|uniref:Uncharacterized protein n=1 Tax=Carnegiea gigantea TaxID=171969 RepID=A0A9Q1GV40_9CARY|nr:hypothetical protein Cgig2_017257 [Carnegiea gigantea]